MTQWESNSLAIVYLPSSITIISYFLWVFHWSLNDKMSPQVSRTLLSILADLNNAVVWTVSTHPIISKSSCPCTNPLVTVPRAPITIVIIVTFVFHSFFNSLARSRYLSLFSYFLKFYSVDRQVHNPESSLFFGDYCKVWSSSWD